GQQEGTSSSSTKRKHLLTLWNQFEFDADKK
nr:hypothetical protein [Tanacetum cinerariifolium]